MDDTLLKTAQAAFDSGLPSPYLTSSSMDMAHRIGLWCKAKDIYPGKLHPSRGYTWKLNIHIVLSFKDSKNPDCIDGLYNQVRVIYDRV